MKGARKDQRKEERKKRKQEWVPFSQTAGMIQCSSISVRKEIIQEGGERAVSERISKFSIFSLLFFPFYTWKPPRPQCSFVSFQSACQDSGRMLDSKRQHHHFPVRMLMWMRARQLKRPTRLAGDRVVDKWCGRCVVSGYWSDAAPAASLSNYVKWCSWKRNISNWVASVSRVDIMTWRKSVAYK